jgi:hypothetical protein
LVFEVFNLSDKTVTVRGFGLDCTYAASDEWHEYELARQHPARNFPVRLEPHNALDGFIETDFVADEIHERGNYKYFVEWKPHVDVAGYGVRHVEAQPEQHPS